MLAVSDEVKQAYQTGALGALAINFYPAGTFVVHPMESLLPSSSLYPGSKGTPEFSISERQLRSESMTITEGLFSGDVIDFRSCYASKCSVTLLNVDADVYDYEMEIIQTVAGEKVPLFTGTVDEAKKRDNKISVVAYDYLYYNYNEDMSDWYNSLVFPMTAKEFRLALYDACNIPYVEMDLINDNVVLQKAELTDKVTGREFLAMIGELNGAFVHVNRKNELTYVTLQNITYIYPGAEQFPGEYYPGVQTGIENIEKVKSYLSCEHEGYKTKDIDKLVLEGDTTLMVGDGSNAYTIADNILINSVDEADLQSALDNLFMAIKGLPYVPHTTVIRGRPYVEVGDVISIKTKKKAFDTYIFKRTLKGVRALRDTYEAEGEEYHDTAYKV